MLFNHFDANQESILLCKPIANKNLLFQHWENVQKKRRRDEKKRRKMSVCIYMLKKKKVKK